MTIPTRQDMAQLYGLFWSRIWRDQDLTAALQAGNIEAFAELESRVDRMRDIFARASVPLAVPRHMRAVWIDEDAMERTYPEIGTFNLDEGFTLDTPAERPGGYILPVDATDVSIIMDTPVEPSVVWVKGEDFQCHDGYVRMFRNPFDSGFVAGVRASGADPVRRCRLWLVSSTTPDDVMQEMYGQFVGLRVQPTRYYRRLLNAVWDLAVEGGTAGNVLAFLSAIADTEVCRADGTVVAIWTEAGRRWMDVGGLVHSAPEVAGEMVSVGDAVEAGQGLFDTARLLRGTETILPDELPGLHAGAGFLSARYHGGLLFENTELPLTTAHFPVGGHPDTVAAFWEDVDTSMAAAGLDLWTILTEDQPGPLYTVNPFDFIRRSFLKNNCCFAVINMAAVPADTAGLGMFGVVLDYIPAGTTIVAHAATESDPDPSPELKDAADAYLAVESSDVDTSGAERYIIGAPKIF